MTFKEPLLPRDAAPLPGAMGVRNVPAPTLEPPVPIEPDVSMRAPRLIGRLGVHVGVPGLLTAIATGGLNPQVLAAMGVGVTADIASTGLAKLMIQPQWRSWVLRNIRPGGEVSPALQALLGVLATQGRDTELPEAPPPPAEKRKTPMPVGVK